MWGWISVAAVVVIVLLGWNLYRRFGVDRVSALMDKRRAGSRIVSSGEFVDGNQRVAVALALDKSTFYYENGDTNGAIDLRWVREVEYDTHLTTGLAREEGSVLRLRCDSQTFEFVLPSDVAPRWNLMLPPRRASAKVAKATVTNAG